MKEGGGKAGGRQGGRTLEGGLFGLFFGLFGRAECQWKREAGGKSMHRRADKSIHRQYPHHSADRCLCRDVFTKALTCDVFEVNCIVVDVVY